MEKRPTNGRKKNVGQGSVGVNTREESAGAHGPVGKQDGYSAKQAAEQAAKEAKTKIDDLVRQAEELKAAADITKLDQKGLTELVTKLLTDPEMKKKVETVLKLLGYEKK